MTTDLGTWTSGAADLVRVSVVPNPGGTQTELWRTTEPVSADIRRYVRVRVTVP